MSQVFHMYSYLVGTPCFQPAFHQRHVTQSFKYLIIGDGRLAGRVFFPANRHLQTVVPATANGAVYPSFVLFYSAPDQSLVSAQAGFFEKLTRKLGFSFGIFGYHQQARSIFVDAVNQTGSGIVGAKGRMIFEMPGQCVNQGARKIAVSGMNHHTGFFVYYQQVLIFVNDVERNVLGNNAGVAGRVGHQHFNFISGFDPVIGLDGLAVNLNHTGLCRVLDAIARNLCDMANQKFVDAQRRLTGIGLKNILFEKFPVFLFNRFVCQKVILVEKLFGIFREVWSDVVHRPSIVEGFGR